ncbi:hypothetical protein BJD49_gp025 [Acinetobacter phage vB_AbaM_phiAbaA1]|uniref:hypothetical protein n=1 Tax=Acinetobacter phage vB_AbaM_phiAbaA1 TaxID=1605379 RepID=UPI00078C26D8|nr:hypothetical protein BJD49_gp025 [Acinetobacter phage vB_AbaM_phiAbaA1]AJK27265.1 hypothetical protein phiAbaA1_162 [Acinetobacter phage vB_AbaM_phiAbaA1]
MISKLVEVLKEVDLLLCGGETVSWFEQDDCIWLNIPSIDEYVVIASNDEFLLDTNKLEVKHDGDLLQIEAFKIEKFNLGTV